MINEYNIIEDKEKGNLLILFKDNFISSLKENNINFFLNNEEIIFFKNNNINDIEFKIYIENKLILRNKNIYIMDEKEKEVGILKLNGQTISPLFDKFLKINK